MQLTNYHDYANMLNSMFRDKRASHPPINDTHRPVEDIIVEHFGQNDHIDTYPNLEKVQKTHGSAAWLRSTDYIVTGTSSMVLRNNTQDGNNFPINAHDVDVLIPNEIYHELVRTHKTPDGTLIRDPREKMFSQHLYLEPEEKGLLNLDIIPWHNHSKLRPFPNINDLNHGYGHPLLDVDDLKDYILQLKRRDQSKKTGDAYKLALIQNYLNK